MYNYQIEGIFKLFMNNITLKSEPIERLGQFLHFWNEKENELTALNTKISSSDLLPFAIHDSFYILNTLLSLQKEAKLHMVTVSENEKANDELINIIVKSLLNGKLIEE